jgi:tetratricopeptide (TPR) repeat protein
VGEPLYRKYLADQNGPGRPAPKNAFERWLGRADAYPKTPLVFPTEEEIHDAVRKVLDEHAKNGTSPDPTFTHSLVTRLIWEKNRDSHEFFVEESFPLEWSYDNALPNGLSYRICRDPLKEIPADVVKSDMAFWSDYSHRLLSNPGFHKDFDAQRSFSKLRTTTGHLYRHRKMLKEAEIAYRQSLALWPGNPESLNAMSAMLWDRNDFDGVIQLLVPANNEDINNLGLWRLRAVAEKRKEMEISIQEVRAEVEKNPKDLEKTEKLLELYYSVGDTNKSSELLKSSLARFSDNSDFLTKAIQFSEMNVLPERELEAAKLLVAVSTNAGDSLLALARAWCRNNDKTNFYATARAAVEKGGLPVSEALFTQPVFIRWRWEEEFQKLRASNQPAPNPTDKKPGTKVASP